MSPLTEHLLEEYSILILYAGEKVGMHISCKFCLTNCMEPAFLSPGGSARLTNGAIGKFPLIA